MQTQGGNPALRRDRVTGANYAVLFYFGFIAGLLGPLVSSLRDDLNLSYTEGSFHIVFWAVGNLLASFVAPAVVRQLGRTKGVWFAVLAGFAGIVPTISGNSLTMTLPGVFITGLAHGVIIIVAIASLSDHHEHNRRAIFAELNALASLGMAISPFVFGWLANTYLGWQTTYLLGALFVGGAYYIFRTTSFGEAKPVAAHLSNKKVPSIVWAALSLLLLAVAMEYAISVWAIDFFRDVVNTSTATATASVGVFYLAMMIGRASGSPLSLRFTSEQMMNSCLILTLIGFFTFWSHLSVATTFIGIFLIGLGIANLYPLASSLAMQIAADFGASDLVSARGWRMTAIGMLTAPFLLATIADRTDISTAYLAVPVIVLATAALSRFTHAGVHRELSQHSRHNPVGTNANSHSAAENKPKGGQLAGR